MTPGTTVTRKNREHMRYVVRGPDPAGPGWLKLIRDDSDGVRESVCCSPGDLTVVTAAPTYSPGDTFRYRSRKVTVVEYVEPGRLRVTFSDYFFTHQPSKLALKAGEVAGEIEIADVVAAKIGGAI